MSKLDVLGALRQTTNAIKEYVDSKIKILSDAAVTEPVVSGWGFTKNTGTYSKPSDGIPKSDLDASVQLSLGKADTALQNYTEQYTGTVKKVNGVSPDADGNVTISSQGGTGVDVTEEMISSWGFTKNTGTYSKPSDGIPKTDLASSVQTSLGKADTALQSYTEKYTGTVKKVNNTSPDSNGNVSITIPDTSSLLKVVVYNAPAVTVAKGSTSDLIKVDLQQYTTNGWACAGLLSVDKSGTNASWCIVDYTSPWYSTGNLMYRIRNFGTSNCTVTIRSTILLVKSSFVTWMN